MLLTKQRRLQKICILFREIKVGFGLVQIQSGVFHVVLRCLGARSSPQAMNPMGNVLHIKITSALSFAAHFTDLNILIWGMPHQF